METTPVGSLLHYETVCLLDPLLARRLKRSTVSTYQDFISMLMEDMDRVCEKVQERRDQYYDKKEDLITSVIVIALDAMDYNATHDTKIGGHVDIVVRGKNPSFLWIGEAKRDSSISWVSQGFVQLCDKYATGNKNQDHGGLLIYCQNKDAVGRLTEWEENLRAQNLPEYEKEACPLLPETAFISKHRLSTSGTKFKVRHISLNLNFYTGKIPPQKEEPAAEVEVPSEGGVDSSLPTTKKEEPPIRTRAAKKTARRATRGKEQGR
ncbi:hypothetical protein [uncultured Azohydromonas sp.]|jgi:hypothetical protein|uniref:hypothetical protein n=1 Tax=uncultured Azohydromonas sp. TaxID=487342 RepID=UPI00260B1350|nr:hypothetical protein [uncultured Azohydromonas sp.]